MKFLRVTFCLKQAYLLLGGFYPAYATSISPELSENIYKVKNMRHFCDLMPPLSSRISAAPSSLIPHIKYKNRQEEFARAIKFVPTEENSPTKGFYIEAITAGNQTYLSHDSSRGEILFEPFNSSQKEYVWHVEQKGPGIYIKTTGGKYLSLVKDEKNMIVYKVEKEKVEGSKWRVHPFYPSVGYSDLCSIFKDYGAFIEKKYAAELESSEPKISKQNSHDPYFVTIQPQHKTNISIREKDCNIYEREAFKIQDILVSPTASTYRFSHVIESENNFETSIQSTLSIGEAQQHSQAKSATDKSIQSKTKEHETSAQRAFTELLSSNIQVSVSHAKETAHEDTESSSSSKTTGKSNSSHGSTGQSLDVGTSYKVEAGNVLASASTSAHTNLHFSASQSSTKEEHESATTNTEKSNSQKQMDRNETQSATQSTNGNEKQNSNAQRQANSEGDTSEKGREDSTAELFSLEKTISVSKLETHKKSEKESWMIEREIIQEPNTALEITIMEKIAQVSNYPFTVDMRVSGYVGYTFKENNFPLEVQHDPELDFIEGSTWYLTPSTIIKAFAVPGYHVNQDDGSVVYKVQAKLSIKKPVNLYSIINHTPLIREVSPNEQDRERSIK